MSVEVRVTAPAKINLSLGVGGLRADGFHPLATVYQAISLHDEVVLRPADDQTLTVSGEGVDVTDVPVDATNLALRAVRLLGQHHGRDLGVAMHLRKRIPVAGGMAGGSTDAAAALLGADALHELHTPRETLLELAAELGSDVPFCLVGHTALGSGRGEQVTPVMTRGQYWWVIAPDGAGLSTPQVYGEFDRLHAGRAVPEPEIPDELLAALRAGDPVRLGAALTNDLQPAALSLRPDLVGLLEIGRACTAYGAMVSGSGPTTIFLCGSAEHALTVAEGLQDQADVVAPLVAKGPVAGAWVSGVRG